MIKDNTYLNIIPSKIYIYLRVSTKSQIRNNSNGLQNQIKICDNFVKEYYKSKKIPIEYYEDIGSSYKKESALKNLENLLNNIESSSILIIKDISRLGRNSFQVFSLLKKIKRANSYIISINDNLCYNFTKLMDKNFYHKTIDAEHSSDIKSIKCLRRCSIIKDKGGFCGRPAYGYKIIKKNNIPYICKNIQEFKIIKLMKLQYNIYKNYNNVAEYLKKNNIKNRKNIFWKPITIKNILKKYYSNIF